ncbi:metaxin-1-like isoform X2 [Oncorhynchus keta]|uniref:metaxin-1-like isoform X2 n=1 Tax=Oncorhynchus keta TaxID=8018 RepID=UPI00227AD6A5|nr:metaxin-1-like isoform X2 [Oncorhynchus keta]
MAAPLELYCWKGDWGLPSVDTDCLTVLAYAKFAGAPLKVHKITNPWRSPTGTLPALKTTEESTRSLSKPSNIIIHLRKQIYTQWVDSKNYVDVTRRWYAENIPFPLNFLLPNRIHNQQLERLRLVRGDPTLEPGEQLEKELYHDALECMTLLSQRLGSHKFFFGDSPSSLDAYVFGHLAPLLKVKLPNGKLQQHLNSLDNLRHYCTNILILYFPSEGGEPPNRKVSVHSDSSDFDSEPHKRRKQILSVLFAMGSMLGYAILMGIVSIQHIRPQAALVGPRHIEEGGEEEEEEEE